ncbi:MAG: hypothetical protein ANABAC_1289 [Anaerolineae bacterium]|nr:MAG: hypothetical protein ANABAC_1289 [Anaerolineae bacterium]
MIQCLRRFWRDCKAELDEAALSLPVILLVSIGLINLTLFGSAAVNAANAANFGARMGSVAMASPLGYAASAANQKLSALPIGEYAVSTGGSGVAGGVMWVRVEYRVPNYFSGLARLFGVSSPSELSGSVTQYFRREGW